MSTVEPTGPPHPALTGHGTPEARWRDAGWLDAPTRVTPADLVGAPGTPVLVVAPHPDDEVLGAGGLLALLAAAGHPVTVLAVTDGEGSHPGSPTLAPADLVVRRRAERAAALAALGLGSAPVRALGLPDGDVGTRTAHTDAVTAAVAELLPDGGTCLSPRPGDGHPDHDAACRAARTVPGVRHVGYGVWFWHWADPDRPDPTPGIGDAVAVDLPAAARDAKRAAAACFTTQVAPLTGDPVDPADTAVLPPPVLARLLRDVEVFW